MHNDAIYFVTREETNNVEAKISDSGDVNKIEFTEPNEKFGNGMKRIIEDTIDKIYTLYKETEANEDDIIYYLPYFEMELSKKFLGYDSTE